MGILDGRVAIITGAGRGIGAAVARYYVRQGAEVVINDLGSTGDGTGADAGPAQHIAAELNEAAGRTVAVADGGDVADTTTGERLLQLALDNFGQLDVLVNAAGILRDRMIFNLSEADWDAVIRVHLRGHYSTIRPASAYWREHRNERPFRIVNFTSESGLHGSPGQPNYAAAKLGIVGLTYSLANALARYGVTANAIAPAAATRLTSTIPDERQFDEHMDEDLFSPDNIAPVVAYLGSTRSGWLSGRTISAGGYRVGLYNTPEEIASFDGARPWEPLELEDQFERVFRPLAEGLPPTPFSAQTEA